MSRQDPVLANRARVRSAFNQSATTYQAAAFLQREVSARVLERLAYIKLKPRSILDVGAGTGIGSRGLKKRYPRANIVAMDLAECMLRELRQQSGFWRPPMPVCAAAESLPFADNSFDMLFSSLTLQWCPDLAIVFQECQRVLKPDGVMVFASLGPDTLKELRASWAAVDATAHVNTFLDMHDVGDAMFSAGFADPVIDTEQITMTFPALLPMLRELKLLGANTVLDRQSTHLMGKNKFMAMQEAYRQWCTEDGLYPASYEVVYGLGWGKQLTDPAVVHVPVEAIRRS